MEKILVAQVRIKDRIPHTVIHILGKPEKIYTHNDSSLCKEQITKKTRDTKMILFLYFIFIILHFLILGFPTLFLHLTSFGVLQFQSTCI